MIATTIVFLALFLASCNPQPPVPKDVLRIAVFSDDSLSLDWSLERWGNPMNALIVQPLYQYRMDKGIPHLESNLVKSAKASDQYRTWDLQLRSDVKWSDGAPFNANHVIDMVRRVLDPKVASLAAGHLFMLKNAEAYTSKKN